MKLITVDGAHGLVFIGDEAEPLIMGVNDKGVEKWGDAPKKVCVDVFPVDPYAELKAAHAAGKTIQYLKRDGEWDDVHCNNPLWNKEDKYRIKPEPPSKQPLSMEFFDGAQSIWISKMPSYSQFTVVAMDNKIVSIFCEEGHFDKRNFDISWGDLMSDCWSYSIDGRKTWHPCFR